MAALSLLVLRAAQPDALAGFYGALGLAFRRERHGKGPEHHSCDLGGAVLEIYPLGDAPPTAGLRLGFAVHDLDETLAAVARNDASRVLMAPMVSDWGRRAVILDPEGHKVELLERPAAAAA